jgi:hypothetical protein
LIDPASTQKKLGLCVENRVLIGRRVFQRKPFFLFTNENQEVKEREKKWN